MFQGHELVEAPVRWKLTRPSGEGEEKMLARFVDLHGAAQSLPLFICQYIVGVVCAFSACIINRCIFYPYYNIKQVFLDT
jgi:hypothetical protein